jgi:hypothetical protein
MLLGEIKKVSLVVFVPNKTSQSNIVAGKNVTGRDDNSVNNNTYNINAPIVYKNDANLQKLTCLCTILRLI